MPVERLIPSHVERISFSRSVLHGRPLFISLFSKVYNATAAVTIRAVAMVSRVSRVEIDIPP